MVLGALSSIGIYLEEHVGGFATRAGLKPIGWPAGAQTGSLIYRLPADPAERASLFSSEQRIRVSEGEVAVVIKDGLLLGTMEPGTYRTEKKRVLGDVDVVWMKTGPRIVRWGIGNVMSRDGIQVGANGTVTLRIEEPTTFNAQVVQGALTLPDAELQRILMPSVQGVLRSMLAASEALALMSERDAFSASISRGLGENLGTLGLALTGFEVAEFNLPAEFKDAMASATLASARGKGDVIEAQTAMQRRVLEAQGEAAAMLLTGDARTRVFQQLQSAGIDPMSLEAMDALKKLAENPSAGGVLGGDVARIGLIGSMAQAAIQANRTMGAPPIPEMEIPTLESLEASEDNEPHHGLASGEPSPDSGGAGSVDTPTVASLTRQLDKLTERLAEGEISEGIYLKLAGRLEERIAALEGRGTG